MLCDTSDLDRFVFSKQCKCDSNGVSFAIYEQLGPLLTRMKRLIVHNPQIIRFRNLEPELVSCVPVILVCTSRK